MLLSEFIKDFGVNKYFRTPKNIQYALLANFIQLVLEGDWIGTFDIPKDFSENADISKYFRVLDQEGHPTRDALRFGDMYIILSPKRYRYGVFLNPNMVIEQTSQLDPQHMILQDKIQKEIDFNKSKGYEVVLLRPLNQKNIFPSDDLRYIKQDKPFAHVVFDVTTNKYTVYAPGNHVTYSSPIWGQDPTNKDIEELAKMEIYRPLWLHVLDRERESVQAYEGTYENANFTTWEVPADDVTDFLGMFALLRVEEPEYTTDNIKWTDAIPKRPMFYDPKDFGAIGDDTTDDTAAFQAAANAAEAKGGWLWFSRPSAKYKLTDEVILPEGVNIAGDGRAVVTVRQATINKRGFVQTNGAGETVSQFIMGGFKLEGTNSGTADGIFIEGRPLDYFRIHDITVDNFGGWGVRTKGAIVSRIEGVNGQNNNIGGLWADGSDSFVTSISLIACYGNANTEVGVKISKATYVAILGGAADSNQIGHYLVDCFSAVANGTGSESNSLANWKIEGSEAFGSTGVCLVGCYSYDAGLIGFDIVGYATNVQLMGCIDNFPDAATSTYSLQAGQFTTVTAIGCKWSNPNNIHPSCAFVEVVDVDGNSHFRNVNLLRIRDTRGNLILDATGGPEDAVNAYQIINAITGHAPLFGPAGPDANIAGYYTSKGTGAIRLAQGDGTVLFQVDAENNRNTFYATPANDGQAALFGVTSDDLTGGDEDVTMYLQSKGQGSIRLAQLGGYVFADFGANMEQPVNWPTFLAVNTGQAVEIGAAGGDTDIYLNLLSKGTGRVRANGHDVVTIDEAALLTNKTFPNVVIDGSSGIMTLNASTDAGDYNIGVDTGGILAFYGGGAEVLSVEMWDGNIGIGSQDPTKGLILTAPSFARFKVTVDNSGVLTTTLV